MPGIYQPSKTQTAQALLRAYVEGLLPAGWMPLDCALAVDAVAWLPMPQAVPKRDRATALPTRRPDCDNLLKTVCDALDGLVWTDDARIVTLSIRKRYCEQQAWPHWWIDVRAAASDAAITEAIDAQQSLIALEAS